MVSRTRELSGLITDFDAVLDAFVPPKPYDSWTLDENSARWQPPVSYPTDGHIYIWNESTFSWQLRDV
jgi:hypothetical protein